jgi:hypothetical protein
VKRDDSLPRRNRGLSANGEGQPREDEDWPGRNAGHGGNQLRRNESQDGCLQIKVEEDEGHGFGGKSRRN